MDSRLKKILDASELRKAQASRVLASQRAQEDKIRFEKMKMDKLAASAWVESHLFNLIEKADKDGKDYIELTDYKAWNDPKPSYHGIPALFLSEEVQKIEGLRIEAQHIAELSDHDGPGYPAHTIYKVKWSPEPPQFYYDPRFNYK